MTLAIVLAGALGAGGCVSTTVIQTNAVAADTTTVETPEEELLDVGITVFDPGMPPEEALESAQKRDPALDESVREAESRYLPFMLSETMQRTGYWGAVRVIPGPSNSVDLTVTGRILHSDGERLAVHVEARDSTGRLWLDREYEDLAGQLNYRESLNPERVDPFQDLYNTIANDLAEVLRGVPAGERLTIRQVSELRFAGDLAPDAFGDYLAEDDGRYMPRRLPAYSDPMVARMRRIREREYLFFDTLDEHYDAFAGNMEVPYSEWRKYTYEEVINLRELKRQALAHKLIGGAAIAGGLLANSDSAVGNLAEWTAITGGIAALKVGIDKGRQAKLNLATLEELNGSFQAEVEPMVMEIEGQTVTLEGSLDSQFDEWRGILRDIYALETGQIARSPAAGGATGAPGAGESSRP